MTKNNKTTAAGATPKTSESPAEAASTGKKEEATCEKVSMNVVQEMLKIQMDTILACFNQVVSNLSQKVDGIMCDVQDLKTSLNFISTDFEEKVKNISDNVTLVKKEISNTNLLNHDDRTAVKYNREKLVDLEDRSRRNNLRVDGMIESERENWEVTEEKVKSLFREQLNISEEIEIDRAHRVGRWDKNKPRTIVLRCHRYKQKVEIQRAAKKLKGTGVYINDDYSNETLQIRKELLKTARELKLQGKGAKVIKDRLVTWELEKRNNDDGDGSLDTM